MSVNAVMVSITASKLSVWFQFAVDANIFFESGQNDTQNEITSREGGYYYIHPIWSSGMITTFHPDEAGSIRGMASYIFLHRQS